MRTPALARLPWYCLLSSSASGAGGVRQGLIDVSRFQLRVSLQDPLAAAAAGDQPHDRAHRDAQPANAGLAAHHGGIVADAGKGHGPIVGRSRQLAPSGEGLGGSAGLKLVLHQESLNPVVVALLVDPIGDGHRSLGHLEPFAEGPGQALQLRPGQGPESAVEVLDRLGIEGHLAGVGRG